MNCTNKDKLKHDFLNSIVIINSLTKSAANFLHKISPCIDEKKINQKQMEQFLYSMNSIREQTAKIELYFQTLMNE
ncbi:MAG: hypothetical protein H0U70_12735 [Tatlockia sp.]|nr:hypothetical protein [Tatlockia sp.]